MGVIEDAVAWAIETANDQSHGYSQADRWGPDYDCSSFVISALEAASLPMKAYGASYTVNMPQALKACGFTKVKGVNLSTGAGLLRGGPASGGGQRRGRRLPPRSKCRSSPTKPE